MQLSSTSFQNDGPIPGHCAFAVPHPEDHISFSSNKNPHLKWEEVPEGTKSFVIICTDPDCPSVGTDVNIEGRHVAADLPRTNFHHWVMVDIPANVTEIAEGACSEGVSAGGKDEPAGPDGSRQGINDYSGWFAGDDDMEGQYFGYDGPCPPWNDLRPHRYRFSVYALDTAECPVDGAFSVADVNRAMAGHLLGQASITGLYTLNPKVSL